jgi:small subunit ribosomal protein S17
MKERGIRIKLTGVVVGSKMDKTAVVLVDTLKKHKTYSKYIRRHSKYLAHDPENKCQPGDRITIIESRPISKTKRWKVAEILEKAEGSRVEETSGENTLEQEK